MSRAILFSIVLAALVLGCLGDRNLLQNMNCGGAKQLDGKCCQMCWCIGENSEKKALAAEGIQKICREQCQKCADEAKKCPKESDSLPEICSKGLAFNDAVKGLVDKCLGLYRSDKNAINQAKGC